MPRAVTLVGIVLCFAVQGIRPEGTWKTCEGGAPCVCYDGLDCFSVRKDCGEEADQAHEDLPEDPGDLGTTFLLYDKENKDLAVELGITDGQDIFENAKFDKTKKLKIIVHGAWSPNFYGLLEHIKEAFFEKHDFNIFMVNWVSVNDVGTVNEEKLKSSYRPSSRSTRLVGRQLGIFLKYIHDEFEISYDNMHLIGHNLGAHVAGYAGKYISETEKEKVARITGLAPSAPYFEKPDGTSLDAKCRLDKDDATFVEVIHADIPPKDKKSFYKITLGMKSPIGKFDFYPNEGKDPQPGCKHMLCSHGRPVEFYEQTIKGDCSFESKPCGPAKVCPQGGCPNMGYNTNTKLTEGSYCVDTTDKEPFCTKPKPQPKK